MVSGQACLFDAFRICLMESLQVLSLGSLQGRGGGDRDKENQVIVRFPKNWAAQTFLTREVNTVAEPSLNKILKEESNWGHLQSFQPFLTFLR